MHSLLTPKTETSSAATHPDTSSCQKRIEAEHVKARASSVLVLSTLSTTLALLCLCGLISYLYYSPNIQRKALPPSSSKELSSASQPPLDETGTKFATLAGRYEQTPSSGIISEGGADKEEDVLSPLPLIHPFVPIWGLADIPLLGVQNMGTLTLRWEDQDTSGATEMVFNVDSITRSYSDSKPQNTSAPFAKTTTLLLSSGHTFVVKNDRADLYDPTGKQIHSMLPMRDSEVLQTAVDNSISSSSSNKPSDTAGAGASADSEASQLFLRKRRLQYDGMLGGKKKLKKPKGFAPVFLPNGPPTKGGGPPTSFMDAYCRYGCGGMSVTFPYYYRPFFGYGFPLVGTEAMFPQGYGGYAAAPLLSSQGGAPTVTGAGGPVIAGGVPASSFSPGVGAANVLGGVQPVSLALPGL